MMDSSAVASAVDEIAEAIISDIPPEKHKELGFIGIQQKGVPLAERLARLIESNTGISPPVAKLDTSMYRDDIGLRRNLSMIHETTVPFDLDERIIVLVDDVLQSGRTIRAALDAITDYGRPSFIRLAVLFDRGGREFPIQADYTGRTVTADPEKRVRVSWSEIDGRDCVELIDKKPV